MRTYHAIDVAKRFLELASSDAAAIQDISNMKLQKLCFFAQLVSLCQTPSVPLIHEQFQAWDYGPVEPNLYWVIRHLGSRFFSLSSPEVAAAFSSAEQITDGDALTLIGLVWDKFKTWSSIQLSELTHRKNSPWAHVYSTNKYQVIPNDVIVRYRWGEA